MAEMKTKIVIESKKFERKYIFECEQDAPLGEVYDAVMDIREYIVQRINSLTPAKEDAQVVTPEVQDG